MKTIETGFDGLLILEPKVFKDSRGFFTERFNKKIFKELGLPVDFSQDNHSRSQPKVLRGLHIQNDPPQGKLVGVIRGAIWDVVVDMRPHSKTYLKNFGVELSEDNFRLLWVPAGFAHGFCVMSKEPADVVYKVDSIYNPKTEAGIMWNDPKLAISWPVTQPTLSERDQKLMSVQEFTKWQQAPK